MSSVNGIVEEMRGEYLAHCQQQLKKIEHALEGEPGAEALDFVRDQAHSIKGSAFTFGLPELSQLCAVWEQRMKTAAQRDDDARQRLAEWRRYLSMFAAMLGLFDGRPAAMEPGEGNYLGQILIWTPFPAGRDDIRRAVEARGGSALVGRTDSEALRLAATRLTDGIISDRETDADLSLEQRARLLAAAARGANAHWFVYGAFDDDEHAFIRFGGDPWRGG